MNVTAFLKPQYLLVLFFTIQLGLASVGAEPIDTHSNTPPSTSVSQDISKQFLQERIDALTERKGLDDALKLKLQSIYQSAQDNLISIAAFNDRAATFKTAIQQAPELSRKLQKDIERASEKQAKPDPDDFIKIPIEELTQRLVIEQAKVNNLDEQIRKLDNQLAEQNTRPNFIRQELLTAKQQMDEALRKLKDNSLDKRLSKPELDAEQLFLKTQVDAKTAELNALDAETSSYTARLGLLKDRLQLLRLQKSTNTPLIDTIENVLTGLRDQEQKNRQDALTQAEKELVGKPVVIQDVTHENIEYSQQLQAINDKITFYGDEKSKTDKQISDIEADFNSAAKKIDLASLSPPLGKLLHEQRRNLINREQFGEQSDLIETETANTNLEQLIIEDKLKKLADLDAYLKQKMDTNVSTKIPASQRMMTQAELRVLLNYQTELLSKLSIAYNTYLRTLGDFDFARQEKHNKIGKFALYLDEHLLWVRSSEALNSKSIENLYNSVRWFLSPNNWLQVVKNIANMPTKKPFLVTLALLNIGALLLIRKWIRQRLSIISDKVGHIYSDRFYYTLESLLYTILLNLPVPLAFFYLGELLSSNAVNDHFTQSIGMGIKHVSVILFSLQLFYRLSEPSGILRKHFQWQEGVANLLYSQLFWLRFVLVAGWFIIKTTQITGSPVYSDNLGRLAVNINVLALTFFLTKLLHPKRGLIQYIPQSTPSTWLFKLRYLYFIIALSPLIILGFSIAGYYLSALELLYKLMVTLWLVAVLVIIYEIGLRALTLFNRYLAIKNQQQRRQLATYSEQAPSEENIIDIPSINAQSVNTLNILLIFSIIIGFWLIWHNIFFAFSFLERVELWRNKITVNNQETEQVITLVNLFWAGIYSFIALMLVRNLTSIAEILLFRRVTIESGSRYAIQQLFKYLLMTLGFFAITNELGFSWSQVQWLVAALSVGLGFGLQEIFANFVSGIILLFERPIRVGDIVTIGDVSGKVSRIHMRATTLTDFDQKELIVPNKTFITTQLINWSLSDSITRLVIPVDIAYGTDIEFAHKTIMDAVISAPLVLKEPEPHALLLAFAESALQFSVRVFVSETAHRLPATHDLHIRIAKALKEHHIEIPFPQRDIHIRSVVTEIQHPNVV